MRKRNEKEAAVTRMMIQVAATSGTMSIHRFFSLSEVWLATRYLNMVKRASRVTARGFGRMPETASAVRP